MTTCGYSHIHLDLECLFYNLRIHKFLQPLRLDLASTDGMQVEMVVIVHDYRFLNGGNNVCVGSQYFGVHLSNLWYDPKLTAFFLKLKKKKVQLFCCIFLSFYSFFLSYLLRLFLSTKAKQIYDLCLLDSIELHWEA